jgi:hypothetical protein
MGTLLAATTITTAVTNQLSTAVIMQDVKYMAVQGSITYGSGGTNAKMWLQTSIDEGTSWIDIAEFTFTTSTAKRVYSLDGVAVTTIYTPTDAAITANTSKSGIFGDRFRVKYTTTGTYSGSTSIRLDATVAK